VFAGSVLAVRTTEPPGQKDVEPVADTETVGRLLTVTVMALEVAEQLLLVTVTV
jgi:hypothetical protein